MTDPLLPDLRALTVPELLKVHTGVAAELRTRGVTLSSNARHAGGTHTA